MYYTIDETARICKVHRTTVIRWIKDGVLSAIVVPFGTTKKTYRIPKEELEKFTGNATQYKEFNPENMIQF